MTNEEMEEIIEATKVVSGDIDWQEDDDHSPALEFRTPIKTDQGHQLFIRGSYNPAAGALTYAVIDKATGCIYRLDLGKEHKNPDGKHVGEKHKHRWTVEHGCRWAYYPQDITASHLEPLEAWMQFCKEFKLDHKGHLKEPPAQQISILG